MNKEFTFDIDLYLTYTKSLAELTALSGHKAVWPMVQEALLYYDFKERHAPKDSGKFLVVHRDDVQDLQCILGDITESHSHIQRLSLGVPETEFVGIDKNFNIAAMSNRMACALTLYEQIKKAHSQGYTLSVFNETTDPGTLATYDLNFILQSGEEQKQFITSNPRPAGYHLN